MREKIYEIYHKLQQNYASLAVVAWMQEHFITTLIGDVVNYPNTVKYRKHPDKYLKKSRDYYGQNASRIDNVLGLLADDESRKAYKAAIRYRTERRKIRRSEWSLKDQYFVRGIIEIGNNEVFIDGGAYNGDTLKKLFRYKERYYPSRKIKRIVAFEPSDLGVGLIKKQCNRYPNLLIKKGALSKEEGDLYFKEQGSSSYLTAKEKSNKVVHAYAIDEDADCKDATFIKMDIEGAEWEALHGAEKTILSNKPKLAICIYHSDEDMIRIPEYIHDLLPDYKLFIRHHTRRDHETVLYATS